jgi:hypothetical protein
LFAGSLALLLLYAVGCDKPHAVNANPSEDGKPHATGTPAATPVGAGTGGTTSMAEAGTGGAGRASAAAHTGTGGNNGLGSAAGASADVAADSHHGTGRDDLVGGHGATGGNSGASSNTSTAGDSGSSGSSGVAGGSESTGTAGNTDSNGNAGAGDDTIKPVMCETGGASSVCGNGVLEPGESCDGADVRGLTCTTLDPFFTAGALSCATNCTLDTNHCVHGTCGNGVIDPGEDCEPSIFDGNQTPCSSLLPAETDNALVQCTATTCRYDFSNCDAAPKAVCGNGKLEAGEQCDGEARFVRTCVEYRLDYTGGGFGCTSDCRLDISRCTLCDGTRCGDGIIGYGEQCDGDNLGAYTCADHNRLYGTVSCLSNCNVDYSQCYGGCTIYKGKIIDCN